MSSVKVVVRVRPLNQREIGIGCQNVVSVTGTSLSITKSTGVDDATATSSGEGQQKSFTFDQCYWSCSTQDPHFASQQIVYDGIGRELLDHAFEGYNTCLFAYGQTGSGKSYSMMGYMDEKGIIPRVCDELFARICNNTDENIAYVVEVSYLEIYNERVRDLLMPGDKGNLRVREHPALGPYVEDLSKLVVSSYKDIATLMDEGNKARTVASTNMNATSSRSHAVFTIVLSQKITDAPTGLTSSKSSRICLVDLAGSERADATGATGARLKEGANINRSLTTLGKVISALADASGVSPNLARRRSDANETPLSALRRQQKRSSLQATPVHIPYRDSVLTWLLKDCLGGNSKTVMIAAISPADVNFDETLSTLRYAERAKRIVNTAVINEDATGKAMRELQDEVTRLRARLSTYEGSAEQDSSPTDVQDPPASSDGDNVRQLMEEIKSNEKLIAELTESYEQKLRKSRSQQKLREAALEDLGITLNLDEPKSPSIGLPVPKSHPHLLNLNEDPLMSECLLYRLPPGIHVAGDGSDVDIHLSGDSILPEHCTFITDAQGKVTVEARNGALVYVNGAPISGSLHLRSGNRLILGKYHVFRFNNPEEVRQEREKHRTPLSPLHIGRAISTHGQGELPKPTRFTSPSPPESAPESVLSEPLDWQFALNERERVSGLGIDTIPKRITCDTDEAYESHTHSRQISVTPEMENNVRPRTPNHIHGDARSSPSSPSDTRRNSGRAFEARGAFSSPDRTEQLLEAQRAVFEAKLREMTEKYDKITSQISMSDRQRVIAQQAIQQWRSRNFVRLGQDIYRAGPLLKEANVFAKELGKDVLFQLAVLSHAQYRALSFWELPINSPDSPISDDLHHMNRLPRFQRTDGTLDENTPGVYVKVLDACHNSIYYWTLPSFAKRLQLMQKCYDCLDDSAAYIETRINQQKDPFFNALRRPTFDLIGCAYVSMRNLLWGLTKEISADLISNEGDSLGRLKVVVTFIGCEVQETPQPDSVPPESDPSRMFTLEGLKAPSEVETVEVGSNGTVLPIGSHLIFEISISEISGISGNDYQQVHVQFPFSAFGAAQSDSDNQLFDRIYTTDPISALDSSLVSNVDFTQTIRLEVTPKVHKHIRTGMLRLELFGQRKRHVKAIIANEYRSPPYMPQSLTGLESSERIQPIVEIPKPINRSTSVKHPALHVPVLASFQILEFSRSLANFKACPVAAAHDSDAGVFSLRQGLQRRFGITLSHNDGMQLPWKRITYLKLGNIRKVDKHMQEIQANAEEPESSKAMLPLRVPIKQDLVFHKDGRSVLRTECSWDTCSHESSGLNQVTRNDERIMVTLEWTVELDIAASENCRFEQFVNFRADVVLQVFNRDFNIKASPKYHLATFLTRPALKSRLDIAKYLEASHLLFDVVSRPASSSQPLNGISEYIRGEECLEGWQPHDATLLYGWWRAQQKISRRIEVEQFRQAWGNEIDSTMRYKRLDNASSVVAAKRAIELWRAKDLRDPDLRRLLSIDATNHLHEDMPGSATGSKTQFSRIGPLWRTVAQCSTLAPVVRRGWLNCLEDGRSAWVQRWFVLRRPYLFTYTSKSESDLKSVVGLDAVELEYSTSLWNIFQKRHVFALHCRFHSTLLQAADESELLSWIDSIDPLHAAVAISRNGKVAIDNERAAG
ncbi:hypothetical protein DFS34DRAFT_598959 [Phlyctochytrium arcticum]|nr:hypothetical protein DFS34DRAFT_598959 [Phlyctochytrium arcticum]